MSFRINPVSELKLGFASQEVRIYDTTLRDGEQKAGLSFSKEDKLEIAGLLDDIGVPQIEGGFPAVSRTEVDSIKRIKEAVSGDVLVLSRLVPEDIDAAAESNADIVLLFIASSPLHLEHKLRIGSDEIDPLIIKAVEHARERGLRPSFSTEDSTRTPIPHLFRHYSSAIDAGVERIGITDTIGASPPDGIKLLVRLLKTEFGMPLSIHLHNDLGLATANALSGVEAGADHVATTVLGIGERAGNVPMEEFLVALRTLYGKDLGIDLPRICEVAARVAEISGQFIPDTRPVVGGSVFSHESGIHAAAVLREPSTYELFPPESVGNRRRIVFGKHSGAQGLAMVLGEKDIELEDDALRELLDWIKERGETGQNTTLAEILDRLGRRGRP